jgi:ubiquinone/menaquinone biosynthesis C-methylase UbiE
VPDRAEPQKHAPSLTLDSEEFARDYDQVSAERQFPAGKRLVEDLAVAPGERVLDVGCGTGRLAEHIAGKVGPTGYVLGVDPLPFRIALARARARPGLEFRVGDAYDLAALFDGGFDVVCLNAVFHWLPEKTGPLRQFARVLRPGGRLGVSTGLKHEASPLRAVAAKVLARPPFAAYPRPRDGGTFRVTADEMRDLLEGAGFTVSLLEAREEVRHYGAPDEAIRFSEASSFGNFLGHLPEELRAAARESIKDELAALTTREQGVHESRRRLIAVALRSE